MSHVCVCAKRQQINHYNNNVIHFFFKIDPNLIGYFRFKKLSWLGKGFFLSYKLNCFLNLKIGFRLWSSGVIDTLTQSVLACCENIQFNNLHN